MRRLGVLAGTFDPVHEGHMALVRSALRLGKLEGVALLPMARPAFREACAEAEDRWEMCRLAAAGETGVTVSRAGMTGGVKHVSDALGALKKEFPDSRFTWILGADRMLTLPYLHERDKLFSQCDFLCFPRSGVDAGEAVARARAAGARVEMLSASDVKETSGIIRAQTAEYRDGKELNRRVLCYIAEKGLYQEDLLPRLKPMMNPHRFTHTLGVRKECVRLAALHGADILRSALAGLLHDCAKGMPVREMDEIARAEGLIEDENMYGSGAMLHGPVGAYLARTRFGVRDEEILNAIRGHTIGREGMTKLELVLFVADATEEGRDPYEGLEEIRYLADRSLPAAALKSMELTKKYLEETRRPYFPEAEKARRYLEGTLTEQERALLAAVK